MVNMEKYIYEGPEGDGNQLRRCVGISRGGQVVVMTLASGRPLCKMQRPHVDCRAFAEPGFFSLYSVYFTVLFLSHASGLDYCSHLFLHIL